MSSLPTKEQAGLLTQNISIETINGNQNYSIQFPNQMRTADVQRGIVYGVRVGAAFMVFVIGFLFTKSYRRPVFIINQITLTLLVCESLLFIGYLMGPFRNIASSMTGSYAPVHLKDMQVSAAATIFQVLFIISVEVSLILQASIMFRGRPLGKYLPYIMGTFAMVPIGFWLNYGVFSAMGALRMKQYITDENNWINTVPRLLFAVSVTVFSCFSFVKLLTSVRRRKTIGLRQFAPVHVIFVFTCQTMFIPAVMSFVDYAMGQNAPALSAIASLLVAIFLPLSTVWAQYRHNSRELNTVFVETQRSCSPRSSTSYVLPSPTNTDVTFTRNMVQKFPEAQKPYRAAGGHDEEEEMFNYNSMALSVDQQAARIESLVKNSSTEKSP